MANKITFEINGEKLAVVKPNEAQKKVAQRHYNKALAEALESGAILRAKVEHYMRKQELWNDEKQAEFEKLRKELRDGELKLAAGGIKFSQAKALAMEMRTLRAKLNLLNTDRNMLDINTAEAQAETARFNYLVSVCTVYNETGKAYFSNYTDYENRSNGDVANEAGRLFGLLYYGLEENFELKLPENKFLHEFGVIDEKCRFINKDGHLVDSKGRLINEDGRYVNEDGEFVDVEGNKVDKDGNYVTEFKPFIDDETGEPLLAQH